MSCGRSVFTALIGFFGVASLAAQSRSLEDTFLAGEYEVCLDRVDGASERRSSPSEYVVYEMRALLELGRYDEAKKAAVARLAQSDANDAAILWMCYQVFEVHAMEAEKQVVINLVCEETRSGAHLRRTETKMAAAELMLRAGWDARDVLDNVVTPARQADPLNRWPHLVAGSLALRKGDHKLAGQNFRRGLRHNPADPDLKFGLAVAMSRSQPEVTHRLLDEVLEKNPRHVPALIFRGIDALIRSDYVGAEAAVKDVLAINPSSGEALAIIGVIYNLEGDFAARDAIEEDVAARVPVGSAFEYTTGMLLSRRYLFEEAIPYLWDATAGGRRSEEALFELALAQLRTGEEIEGWRTLYAVRDQDPYHVPAFNLAELQNKLTDFITRKRGRFVLRMAREEMATYGNRIFEILELLETIVAEDYRVDLPEHVVIEIFPELSDFEVRTFGVPLGESYLGVCFGSLITMVSPDAGLGDVNWEAVLVHEFLHTATLTATRNRMPKWLSEGISVWGEQQFNPSWGRRMNAAHARKILEGPIPLLDELNFVFSTDVDFAYYFSSLVVEFAIDRFGLPGIRAWMDEIYAGRNAVEVFVEVGEFGTEEQLMDDLMAYAREQASELADGIEFRAITDIERVAGGGDPLMLIKDHPANYWVMMEAAESLTERGKMEGAEDILSTVIEAYPINAESKNPYNMLAEIYRNRGDAEREIEMLELSTQYRGNLSSAYRRLIELGLMREDWDLTLRNCYRLIAVNPMALDVYLDLARAAESSGASPEAMKAYSIALQLDPEDVPEIYFRMANLIKDDDVESAREFLLAALERVPRYKKALYLLLELNGE